MENENAQHVSYEEAMKRLEQLAQKMENGEVAIDQLSTKLKEAKELLKYCKTLLTKADEEVQKLLAE